MIPILKTRKASQFLENCTGSKEHIRIQRCKVKLSRAQGGCPGVFGRRRARKAAISCDEPQAGIDSQVPEWGNPVGVILSLFGELNPVN